MLHVQADHVAGQMLAQDFPDHLQAAGIEVDLLAVVHLVCGVAVNLAVGRQVEGIGEIQPKVPGLDGELLLAVKQVVQQAYEKFVVVALEGGTVLAALLAVGLAGPVFLQALQGPADRGGKGVRGELQLDQIIHGLVVHGLFDELEFFVAGEKDEQRNLPVGLPAGFRQLQPVHFGHFDVRDHDLRGIFLDQLQRSLPVHGRATDLDP